MTIIGVCVFVSGDGMVSDHSIETWGTREIWEVLKDMGINVLKDRGITSVPVSFKGGSSNYTRHLEGWVGLGIIAIDKKMFPDLEYNTWSP